MSDTISVIVPCYNVADCITATVESILAQTYSDIQLILVDDGSKDNTDIVLDSLKQKDNRIIVIHKENGGVTSARMCGIKASTGEWIGFVDGDDTIEPDMYERLLNNANKYHAQISHCGYRMVCADHVSYFYNTGRLAEQDMTTGLKDLLSGSFVEPGLWNKLFHKSLFHSLLHSGVMDMTIKNTEDLLMNYYLFKQSTKSVYEDFCPYNYILRKNSAATSKPNAKKLTDPGRVFHIIRDDISDNGLIEVVNSRLVGNLTSLATIGHEEDSAIMTVRKNAREELRSMVPTILKGRYSKRAKILGTWCALWPWSYRMVHTVYAHIKGTAHAYEV